MFPFLFVFLVFYAKRIKVAGSRTFLDWNDHHPTENSFHPLWKFWEPENFYFILLRFFSSLFPRKEFTKSFFRAKKISFNENSSTRRGSFVSSFSPSKYKQLITLFENQGQQNLRDFSLSKPRIRDNEENISKGVPYFLFFIT